MEESPPARDNIDSCEPQSTTNVRRCSSSRPSAHLKTLGAGLPVGSVPLPGHQELREDKQMATSGRILDMSFRGRHRSGAGKCLSAANEELEEEQEQDESDCCNTRRWRLRRSKSVSGWSLSSSKAVSVASSARSTNLNSPINALCLLHSRQANQFNSARSSIKLFHRRHFPCALQRHKHSSLVALVNQLKQLNSNHNNISNTKLLSSHQREHITLANNTTTTQSLAAYRWCASKCGRRSGRAEEAPQVEAASGCGELNYDTRPANQRACQAAVAAEDAQQQPPAPQPPEPPQAKSQSRDNNSHQQQTQSYQNNNNNNIIISNGNKITYHSIQEAPGILASSLGLASGSSSPPAARWPAPAAPVSTDLDASNYATCGPNTCCEQPRLCTPRHHNSQQQQYHHQQHHHHHRDSTADLNPSTGGRQDMEFVSRGECRLQGGGDEEIGEEEEASDEAISNKFVTRPKGTTYPNNTLIADLNKCHRNVASAWPKHNWLGSSLKSCWRKATGSSSKFMRLRFHMPDAMVRSDVSITHDDYDRAMCVLTSDVRYQLHLLLYRRVQAIWMLFTTLFCTFAALVLVSNLEAIVTIGALCAWLALQLVGFIVTSRFRRKLDEMLEKSVAQVNSFFVEHNLMLGVINSGTCFISKSKFLIPMLYFNTTPCREYIESIIGVDSRKITSNNSHHHHMDDTCKSYCQPTDMDTCLTGGCSGNGAPGSTNDTANHTTNTVKLILDYSKIGLPLTKHNQMGLAQSLAKKIILRYSQRWISLFDKRKLMFNDDQVQPRHLSTGKCLCQFIEEHFSHNNNNDIHPKRIKTIKCKPQRIPHKFPAKQVADSQVTISISPDIEDRIPCGKRHLNPLESYMLAKPTNKISTLSRLVSLKDRKQANQEGLPSILTTTTTNITCQNVFAQANHLQPLTLRDPLKGYYNGTLFNPYVTIDSLDQSTNATTSLSPTIGSELTSTSSPDVSLEMDTESISRSDELVKKLRLLLELKKDEIQSLEGPLFSAAYCKESPQSTLTNGSQGDGNSDRSLMNSNILNYDNSHETGSGKKMYLQRYGLFFLGASGAKKNHHHHHHNHHHHEEIDRNHPLEMC